MRRLYNQFMADVKLAGASNRNSIRKQLLKVLDEQSKVVDKLLSRTKELIDRDSVQGGQYISKDAGFLLETTNELLDSVTELQKVVGDVSRLE